MMRVECAREQDVLDAIAARRWPDRCDAELRDHVAACSICADVIDVVGPLTDSHDEIWQGIQVPSSGTVWWRAQLRAQQEAARKASRPITVVQGVAAVAALVVIVVAAYTIAPWLPAFTFALPEIPSLNVFSRPSLFPQSQRPSPKSGCGHGWRLPSFCHGQLSHRWSFTWRQLKRNKQCFIWQLA